MIINSKDQIGFDNVIMTELIFNKSVTHHLVFTDYPAKEINQDFTVPIDYFAVNELYPQIISGKEVMKSYTISDFHENIQILINSKPDTTESPYCFHILSKMNRETMTANMLVFIVSDKELSEKFDAIAAYLNTHLMSSYVRIMSTRDVLRERLSDRELSVLTWLKLGKTSWEVAKILNITENTVNFHIKNIKRKLNATNRQHAVAIAIAKGAIE
ncbi:MAG: hypothetical protein C0602_02325 [Denitrovibrio sp.]|nr:MAG: hypothetical protein C0602_02325 [Denitrovibrio sp.]